MSGQINRAIGLWESWHEKQQMLESVFGSGIGAELDKEKYQFLSAGIVRIAAGTNADEKLVLAMLRKTTAKLEKQIYPNPVMRVLRRFKTLVYDKPVQMAKLRRLKAENILSLSAEMRSVGVDPDKLNLDKRLDFESPHLDISMTSPYGTDHNFSIQLHLEKEHSGAYQFKSYTATWKDQLNPEQSRSYTFDANLGVNAREAVNLLQGRAVLKHHQIGENRMGSKWLQLDFNSLTTEGKPMLKEMGADYEYNIRQQLTQIAAELQKPELVSTMVLDGMEKGNQIVLKQVTGETAYLEVNAIAKQVLIRDEQQKPTTLESLSSSRRNQLERKPRAIKLSKTKAHKKQQDQSLHIS